MTIGGAEVSHRLHLPTYQNRLRVIGRQLDLAGYRSVNLLEIAGGFLVRVMQPGERVSEALEFPHTDFPDLLTAALAARGEGVRRRKNHPLVQTGYEDFLRALGYRLDEQYAEAITITELDGFVAVNGVAPANGYHETTIQPFQTLLRPDDVAQLLDEAFRRRTPARVSVFARALGR
ncbi:MAG: hypothetical protein ACR2GA_00310 [Chloroflexota bacterium]